MLYPKAGICTHYIIGMKAESPQTVMGLRAAQGYGCFAAAFLVVISITPST